MEAWTGASLCIECSWMLYIMLVLYIKYKYGSIGIDVVAAVV